MADQRTLPRTRTDVTAADVRHGERVATRAVKAQAEHLALLDRAAAALRRRDALIEEANRLGVSQYRLAPMLGLTRQYVGRVILAVRDAMADHPLR